jgi:hypothetical protein
MRAVVGIRASSSYAQTVPFDRTRAVGRISDERATSKNLFCTRARFFVARVSWSFSMG